MIRKTLTGLLMSAGLPSGFGSGAAVAVAVSAAGAPVADIISAATTGRRRFGNV